jgi:hypothetical protein
MDEFHDLKRWSPNELPPLREECNAEDNAHALSISRCSKEGRKRGVFVDFLLHSHRMQDLYHLVLDERVTLAKPGGMEAREYSCGLAILP